MSKVIERLLNLLAFLLTVRRPVTADEIRYTVAGYDRSSDEAFRRMFERDKDLLRRLGVPIELRPTDVWEVEEGYVVGESYALPDPGLTDEERAALALAAQMVRLGGEATGPGALLKLGGAPFGGDGEPLVADLGLSTEPLAAAFSAVAEGRVLTFTYRDRSRVVHPYALVHRRGHWYVAGDEQGPSGPARKAYRLDRAADVVAGNDPGAFTRPVGFRAADHIPGAPWETGMDDVRATVVFDEEVAWWARRQLTPGSAVEELAGGEIRAELAVSNPDAFIGWILGFEDKAEVVGPSDLRDRLLARVRGDG
jgi:predicted DNA-binding transcriptional regulator YafY